MPSLPRRAAALLAGLSITATALAAGAQVAIVPEPAPLQVAAPTPTPILNRRQGLSDGAQAALISSLVGLGLADVGFGIYDGVKAGRGQNPTTGVGLAEAVVTAPQVIVFDTLFAVLTPDAHDDDKETAALVFLPGITNALFVHGTWSALRPTASPAALYGVPWAVGFDAALALPAITSAAKGRLFPRALGGVEMALTAPQIAVASYGIVKDPHNTAGWATLAGSSGALFVHGLLSAIIPRDDPPPPPPPPPEPPKKPLLVPGSIRVGPAAVGRGGGMSVSGRWW